MAIPVCIPVIPRNAARYVTAVIERNWISSQCLDPEVDFLGKLEAGFSRMVGAGYGIAVTSGTTALELAIAALGIGAGDEVIVPTFTMIASVAGIVHRQARPVLVDADPVTWCLDPERVAAAITERTRAIMAVHIYGYPAAMDRIMELAARHQLYVIEDAAEAIGTRHRGRMAGSIGHIGCFSFYANKTITCGEGGMVVTSDPALAARARMLKDHAFGPTRFKHEEIGFNYRMNNLTAAYAYASFEEGEEYIRGRRRNARLYAQALAGIPGLTLPPAGDDEMVNSHWMYGILIDPQEFGHSREEVRARLKRDHAIETRDFFYPMHRQPALLNRGLVPSGVGFPVADMLWERGCYLPSSTNLTEDEIAQVVAALAGLRR